MESGNVAHADAMTTPTGPAKATRKRRADTRPDALLRYLIEHSEYDLALVFTKGQYILYRRSGSGNKLDRKGIAPDTLYAAFVAEPVDTGWLSPDVMRCGVGPAGAFAVKFIPPGVQVLRFDSGNPAKPLTMSAPLPALVFAGVNSSPLHGNAATYYVWAMREATFSPQARLYHVPLPNVYEEGRICWGENHPPEAGRTTIDQAWRLFIESLFTGEMAGERSTLHPHDTRGLFLCLQGADRFPVADLQPLAKPKPPSVFRSARVVVSVQDAVEAYLLKEDPWHED